MTGVNSTSVGESFYPAAKWLYEMPSKAANLIESAGSSSPRMKKVAGFVKEQLNLDYSKFTRAEVGGRFKTLLAEPPRGALLLLLYPGTVGPRLYRAWQRGKENNDYREMWDVARRDITAITLFVYALPVIVKKMSTWMENATGVKLIDKASQKVLNYSQFDNYEIQSGKILAQIIAEGNGKALVDATKGLESKLAKPLSASSELHKAITSIPDAVKKLVDFFETNAEGEQKKLSPANFERFTKMANGVYENQFKKTETLLGQFGNSLKDTLGDKAMSQKIQDTQGKVAGVLKDFAKRRRLPADVVSFGVVMGLIGYFPVWLNARWNDYQYEKNNAKKTAEPVKPSFFANKGLPSPTPYPAAFRPANSNPALYPAASPSPFTRLY